MSTSVLELELPELTYLDPALTGDRFAATMAELAERGWLAKTELGFCVLDREAGELFLRSRQLAFPGRLIAELFSVEDGPLREEIDRNILHQAGADHRRLRKLVAPFFTPKAADGWRPAMREVLEELWPGGAGTGDVVPPLCRPYPARMIARVMGAPESAAPQLEGWSQWIQRQFDPPSLMAERSAIEQACTEFFAWCRELLARRRDAPADDLVSPLLTVEVDGDRLGEDEVLHLVLNVLVGGVDTTQSQLAQALRLFAAHPDQWELLREDPHGRAPAAVAEVLRHAPITPFTARVVEEELEHRGVTFPVGTVVLVAAWSANREGIGDRFDITAEDGLGRALTFGAGPHYCLGANLAKAELEEALVHLAERVERWEPAGRAVLGSVQGIYGVDELPLAWQ